MAATIGKLESNKTSLGDIHVAFLQLFIQLTNTNLMQINIRNWQLIAFNLITAPTCLVKCTFWLCTYGHVIEILLLPKPLQFRL